MATWDDVRRLALALPDTTETADQDGHQVWCVRAAGKDKGFVWERPLRPRDLAALGDAAPDGEVLCARVPLAEKEALLASEPAVYFTTPHFNGYPAVLARLDALDEAGLEELLLEAWVAVAPKRVSRSYLDSRSS